jgi:uncharacterized protein YegP (UPF0339 family)
MTKTARVHIYRDAAGEWRWRLVAKNGRTIADSAEGYVEKRKAIAGVQLVRDTVRDLIATAIHVEEDTQP